jgi:hypothetical protein
MVIAVSRAKRLWSMPPATTAAHDTAGLSSMALEISTASITSSQMFAVERRKQISQAGN